MKHTKYIMKDADTESSFIVTNTVNEEGLEIEKVVKVMSRFSLYKKANNLDYLNELINKLSVNKDFLLPTFLLRSQLIEFALKHLLINYPYPPREGYGKKLIEFMTMGEIIQKLIQLNDNHLDEVIKEAEKFKKIRNELTHRILTSNKDIDEINKLVKGKLKSAYKIEKNILFFLNYVRETLH